MISSKQIKEARLELLEKSKIQIEEETAIKWGARAIAAYSLFEETNAIAFLFDAIEYHHEAIEHASDTPILKYILAAMEDAKSRVMQTF